MSQTLRTVSNRDALSGAEAGVESQTLPQLLPFAPRLKGRVYTLCGILKKRLSASSYFGREGDVNHPIYTGFETRHIRHGENFLVWCGSSTRSDVFLELSWYTKDIMKSVLKSGRTFIRDFRSNTEYVNHYSVYIVKFVDLERRLKTKNRVIRLASASHARNGMMTNNRGASRRDTVILSFCLAILKLFHSDVNVWQTTTTVPPIPSDCFP